MSLRYSENREINKFTDEEEKNLKCRDNEEAYDQKVKIVLN